jgi:signal transduction histidine kinase
MPRSGRRRPGSRDRFAREARQTPAAELERRSRELASLLEVSQALSATLDLETVLQTTTDSATRLFGIESAAVYLLEGVRLYLGATTPPLPRDLPEGFRSTVLPEHPHIEECVTAGLPVVLPDTGTAKLTPSERAIVEARDLRTLLYVPILLENRPTGVLILGATGRPRAISPDELDLARTAANLIAVSIQNATLHQEAVRQSEALRAQSRTNEALADLSAALVRSGSSLESVACLVLEKAKLLTASEHGFVGSIDPLTRDLVMQTFTVMLGRECQVRDASPVFPIGPDGRYPALWGDCLNAKRGFFTNSPATHQHSKGLPEGHVPLRNFLGVPAIMGDRLVGQIALANCPAGYDDRSLALVERLAELLALAIERTRSESALREAERMAAMGSLVGSVAHEVRNPLFALSAALDAFEARHGRHEESAKYLTLIRDQVERVSQLMQELLEYGRPLQLTLEPQCVLPIVRRAVESCRHEAERRKVATRLRLPGTLANVAADAPRFTRMIQNVIQNAIQHSPAGGFVEVEAAEVADGGEPHVECTVRDSGPGFSEEAIRRAFDPFFTMRQGGTGLGLAIVRKIVEEHQGSITLGNAPGGGAIVRVRLPTSEEG